MPASLSPYLVAGPRHSYPCGWPASLLSVWLARVTLIRFICGWRRWRRRVRWRWLAGCIGRLGLIRLFATWKDIATFAQVGAIGCPHYEEPVEIRGRVIFIKNISPQEIPLRNRFVALAKGSGGSILQSLTLRHCFPPDDNRHAGWISFLPQILVAPRGYGWLYVRHPNATRGALEITAPTRIGSRFSSL